MLVADSYRVLAIGHSQTNCEWANIEIRRTHPNAKLLFFHADLMQQREVVKVAKEVKTWIDENGNGKLFALINNAGCARSWYMTTEDGYEQQFALNHLAGFMLTYQLLPCLLKAGGRIIMTSSESHYGIKVHWNDVMLRKCYNPLTAYKQSKLCNVLFAKGLNEKYECQGLHAYAVDPGLVKTDIGNKTPGIASFVWKFFRKPFGVTPAVPARTYRFLVEQPEPPTGLYYRRCSEKRCSRQVTSENASRLFKLSEKLCGVQY